MADFHLPSVGFDTSSASTETYRFFLNECWDIVTGSEHLGMRVLHPETPLPSDLNNFFLINLSNGETQLNREISLTLVARKSDLYLVGFKSQFIVWFFNDVSRAIMESIFPQNDGAGILYQCLPFTASYIHLEGRGKITLGRTTFDLGIGRMHTSISQLFYLHTTDQARDCIVSKAILNYVQMICEPLRLKKLCGKIESVAQPTEDGVYRTCKPSAYDVSCQNNWGTMSDRAHEQSNLTDTFRPQILMDGNEEIDGCLCLDNAGEIKNVVNCLKSKNPGSGGRKIKTGGKAKYFDHVLPPAGFLRTPGCTRLLTDDVAFNRPVMGLPCAKGGMAAVRLLTEVAEG
ncbi:rRNA N-glycosidase [Striga asiatica]|uniref:rRNA N-glycosylase n=1 Tax=Striga asiatica TaxID=4170 RepID=A0A5A7PR42_STRAF|nr:rRNA N-glycosidase [Striga asiatica]